MQFTFLDMAGNVLFLRDDAERAQWTQEEMTLELEFPYISGKVVTIGQRVYFKDPSTNLQQVYEVKQAKTLEPDHYQTVVAENICISELSDEHIDNAEITDKTAKQALETVLAGTLWSVGTVGVNPTSSMDVNRGSVWNAVLEIKQNWNVYIVPRVTLADGALTRRLDIISTDGEWNGLRLSVDKNMLDPSVTFDDSELVTAMYGYGGTTTPTTKDEEQKEINFADIVWSKTSEHPAKPKGQTYIEDKTATAEYGRNGRARFGFYQNTDILDPELLLQKTWECLKTSSVPSISIDGTVADLYRMGYADTPIKLHDIALVEILPAGYKAQIQIIRITTDLLDSTATTLTIGTYIPNIIYIERNTSSSVTGTSGGGGGNKSGQTQRSEYETEINKNNRMIQLRAYQNDLDDLDNTVKEQEAKIEVTAEGILLEATNRKEADQVLSGQIKVEADRITAEVTARKKDTKDMQSKIEQTAESILLKVGEVEDDVDGMHSEINMQKDRISLVVTDGDNPQIKPASIVASINGGVSTIKLDADHIDIDGVVTKLGSMDIACGGLTVEGRSEFYQTVEIGQGISFDGGAGMNIDDGKIKMGSYNVSWKSYTARKVQLSTERPFMYGSTVGASGVITGHVVIGYTDTTIYYLGRS